LWALPVSVKSQGSNFYMRASIAYLNVAGPDGVIPGDGGVSPGVGGGGTTSRSGIGDLGWFGYVSLIDAVVRLVAGTGRVPGDNIARLNIR
jgi:hypothetical protein